MKYYKYEDRKLVMIRSRKIVGDIRPDTGGSLFKTPSDLLSLG